MEIHRGSWHYRLYRYTHNVQHGPRYLWPWGVFRQETALPSSLCPYAWSIFLGLFAVSVLGALMLALALPIAVVAGIVYAWIHLSRWIETEYREGRNARRLARRTRRDRPKKERPKREPLVASYLKARKERVCPTIKLVD